MFFSKFGPIYECSIVYNYKDKLRFFHDVDEIDQKIKEEELEINLGSGSLNDLKKLKK
jgi:cell division protein FtsL